MPIESRVDLSHLFGVVQTEPSNYHDRRQRLPARYHQMGLGELASRFYYSLGRLKTLLEDQPRLAVPQFFRDKHMAGKGEMQLICPLCLDPDTPNTVDCAVVIRRVSNNAGDFYQPVTVLSPDMVTVHSRLVGKPDQAWLTDFSALASQSGTSLPVAREGLASPATSFVSSLISQIPKESPLRAQATARPRNTHPHHRHHHGAHRSTHSTSTTNNSAIALDDDDDDEEEEETDTTNEDEVASEIDEAESSSSEEPVKQPPGRRGGRRGGAYTANSARGPKVTRTETRQFQEAQEMSSFEQYELILVPSVLQHYFADLQQVELASLAPLLKTIIPRLSSSKGLCKSLVLAASAKGLVKADVRGKQTYVSLPEAV